MQRDMLHPERLVVGHPFNPVYLMPLVEVCGGEATSDDTKERAAEVYRSIGMHPLMLSKEIDGFVADRLMEALWREALWLVNDGVATARRDRRRHALRARSAVELHGNLHDLPHRRRTRPACVISWRSSGRR
jgi:hypothetical protein